MYNTLRAMIVILKLSVASSRNKLVVVINEKLIRMNAATIHEAIWLGFKGHEKPVLFTFLILIALLFIGEDRALGAFSQFGAGLILPRPAPIIVSMRIYVYADETLVPEL